MLNPTDITLLELLQQDGSLTTAQLAEHVSLSVTPCWRRLKRLEEDGVIQGYQANLDRRKLGLDVLAFVQIRFMVVTDAATQQFEDTVLAHPAVLSCHKITGEADYMLQVVATDLDAYGSFMETVLRKLPGISSIHSNLALREIKATHRFPLEQAGEK
ncbi:MAG: Lrp/AsnC family transcriptional regulator [Rhodoferax sp.]|nr:MAG: Lrp/AsnC family transcriptional regulator [Rhodoferax sp.]